MAAYIPIKLLMNKDNAGQWYRLHAEINLEDAGCTKSDGHPIKKGFA